MTDKELFEDARIEFELWHADRNLPLPGRPTLEHSSFDGQYVYLHDESIYMGRYDSYYDEFLPLKEE